jgi:hypothetical protein
MLKVRCSSLYPEIHCSMVTGYVTQVGKHKEKTNDLYLGGTGFELQLGQRFLWKGVRVQIFGNNFNKSKFYSGRN